MKWHESRILFWQSASYARDSRLQFYLVERAWIIFWFGLDINKYFFQLYLQMIFRNG